VKSRGLLLALLLAFLALPAFAQEAPPPPDTALTDVQYTFSGAWLPDEDAALIGAENFSDIRNLRYTDTSLVGIGGYSKINDAALTTYTLPGNGFHLATTATDAPSNILVWGQNASGSGAVLLSQTAIPEMGNFTATPLHADAAGAGTGRFSRGPSGTAFYCNGLENRVWGGNETRASGFFTVDGSNGTNPKDSTLAVQNNLATAGNFASVGGSQLSWIVLSSRALAGVRYEMRTVNAAASTTSASFWNGTGWQAVSGFSDQTKTGGVSLAQNGWMRFSSTVGSAEPKHFEGAYLYAYLFTMSAGSAEISHVTVDAPWQPLVDVWDGVNRECLTFQLRRSGENEDYTGEVAQASSVSYPIVALMGNATATDEAVLMFKDRLSAIKITMLAGYANNATSTASLAYWNGTAWTTPSGFTDGTASGGATFAQTGLMSWQPPAEGQEFPQSLFGKSGYTYRLKWSATLKDKDNSGVGTSVDTVFGVPAPVTVPAFNLSAMYRGRAVLLNHESGNEPNRVDYSFPNTPDVWNGAESSDGGYQSLYVGGEEPIVAAIELYNRYGSSLFTMLAVLKAGETYSVKGSTPEDFEVSTVSTTVGCAAPLTLATAEMGFRVAEDVQRNVAMWLSYSGPVLFDGAYILPMRGVDSYFDPSDVRCVNYDAIEGSRGWYDATFKEYHLLIPSGSGQTTNNVWLIYDMTRKKWRKNDTGTAPFPQMGFSAEASRGVRYCYAGTDDGFIRRLEHGTSWDGVAIDHRVSTGDIWVDQNVWYKTLIRRLKVIAKYMDEDHVLAISHIADSEDDGIAEDWTDWTGETWADWTGETWSSSTLISLDLSPVNSLAKLVRDVEETNLLGWSHKFTFQISTDDTEAGDLELVGWGLQHRRVRVDK